MADAMSPSAGLYSDQMEVLIDYGYIDISIQDPSQDIFESDPEGIAELEAGSDFTDTSERVVNSAASFTPPETFPNESSSSTHVEGLQFDHNDSPLQNTSEPDYAISESNDGLISESEILRDAEH
ncbi:hypothetical protein ACMFMG_001893 [Clarireedia jacksonii]